MGIVSLVGIAVGASAVVYCDIVSVAAAAAAAVLLWIIVCAAGSDNINHTVGNCINRSAVCAVRNINTIMIGTPAVTEAR